jgi:hypothetical protein
MNSPMLAPSLEHPLKINTDVDTNNFVINFIIISLLIDNPILRQKKCVFSVSLRNLNPQLALENAASF